MHVNVSRRAPAGRLAPRWAAAGLGLALSIAAVPLPAQSGELRWPEVTHEARPWTRWWWMGSAVDEANLARELRLLSAAGFGGVEVTSIYGARGYEDRYVPYLSDRWIELLKFSAAEAKRLGMGIDMPPGSGWRTGGPDVPRTESSASLKITADTVRAGDVWTAERADRHIEAIVAVSGAGRRVDLGRRLRPGAALRWRAPRGEWVVYTAETRFGVDNVKRPAPGGAGYAIDVLSRRAVDNFLTGYGGRLGDFPDGTLRALFHDSYEYSGDGSTELFAAFRAHHGYRLEDHLPAMLGQGEPDGVARVKSDYRHTLNELLLANFLEPLKQWARAHGSVSRNQAHGSPGNLLDLYAASDIPETEIFGPLGGTDADPLISKFASSAAHVAGRRLASAEAMTWLGEHFTVSLDDVKRAADQLFVSGINHLIYHGTAYSPEQAAWPGWLFYASTQFNPRNAIWRDLPALNAYVTRVQSVLQQGLPDADVLLYWPIHDSWHDPAGTRIDFRVHSPRWFHENPIGEVATTMWRAGYAFDYLSDRLLAREVSAAAEGGLRAGGAGYRVIVVPRAGLMPVETFTRLLGLAEQGATIAFVGDLPRDVPGLARLRARRTQFADERRRVTLGEPGAGGVRAARLGQGRVLVGESVEALLQAAGVPREPLLDHGVHFVRRRDDGGRYYFLTHTGTAEVDGWVRLATPAAAVAILDPVSGRLGLAESRPTSDGATEVHLQLAPGESLILRTSPTAIAAAPWAYRRTAGSPAPLRGTWSVEFIDGGPLLPEPFTTTLPRCWTERGAEAERFAGTARYRLRFDAPGAAGSYLLDLGRVAESARVRLNGHELGTLFARPFRLETGPLRSTGNELEIEVTNLSANRVRDLDRRAVTWKTFHDINFVGIDYQPFDASDWPVRPSGLLGPVTLQPLQRVPPPAHTAAH
jgi:hypothetical protein